MNLLASLGVAVIFSGGFYLVLQRGLINRVLGLLVISHGANFVLMLMGGFAPSPRPPLLQEATRWANPLPQALILTALVIGFAVAVFLWALVLRLGRETE